jgi:hypothetical protein
MLFPPLKTKLQFADVDFLTSLHFVSCAPLNIAISLRFLEQEIEEQQKGVENKKGVDATSLCECAPIRNLPFDHNTLR